MERLFQFKLIVLLLMLIGQNAWSNTIIAEPNNPQKTIKKAFEQAKNGDTILTKAGVYREGTLFLNKAVTMMGEEYHEIDGEYQHEIALQEHDDVVIKNVLISNSGSSSFQDIADLKIKNYKTICIEVCRFENNLFSIQTFTAKYVSYINNLLSS